ncbi:hypothetical protein SAMN05216532_5889 [Streptomyces sp. 2231.1]|uniref:hypothetical protein n=1 Tax=Streptomyces sp. 2231.1 TaxID=1855347 RepID=UPI00089C3366|nr:hypothetical protein SAMN05216532_5889 [Streptomyces sp. 2231.1]
MAFIALAVVGCGCTLRLLARDRGEPLRHLAAGRCRLMYALIAVVGAFPEPARPLGLTPVQAEALMLIVLVVLGPALVWRFMAGAGRPAEDAPAA